LVQQTSGCRVTYVVSHILQEPMFCIANIGKPGLEPTALATNEVFSAGEDAYQSSPLLII
jgi:hypothetical protein